MSDNLYFKGVPTAPDVEKIMAKFGALPEGSEIPLVKLAEAINAELGGSRLKSVVASWRKRMYRERNIDIQGTGDGCLRFNTPEQRVAKSGKLVESGRRAIGKAIVLAYNTDNSRLTTEWAKARQAVLSLNQRKIDMASAVMPEN